MPDNLKGTVVRVTDDLEGNFAVSIQDRSGGHYRGGTFSVSKDHPQNERWHDKCEAIEGHPEKMLEVKFNDDGSIQDLTSTVIP